MKTVRITLVRLSTKPTIVGSTDFLFKTFFTIFLTILATNLPIINIATAEIRFKPNFNNTSKSHS